MCCFYPSRLGFRFFGRSRERDRWRHLSPPDIWPGLLLWLGASMSFVAVHSALWTKNSGARPRRYLLAAVIMSVPPFGITGWAHPVTAAGVLFPGWGWWGVG